MAAKAAEAEPIIIRQVIVDLPPNQTDTTIEFSSDCPPRVVHASGTALFENNKDQSSSSSVVGYYIASFHLPDIEISNFQNASTLQQLLTLNSGVPRRLVLSSHPPPTYPLTDGCVYYYKNLPTGDLGIHFTGFPPHIESILPTSPLLGKGLRPNQDVEAVVVPGQPALTAQSPGFTASRVRSLLEKYSHVTGRGLVVKDINYIYSIKRNRREVEMPGEADPVDFGGLFPWFRRRKR